MSGWRAIARRVTRNAALVLCALLPAAHTRAQGAGDGLAIPAPAGFVNDRAGVMDDDARARLESFLDQVKRKTGAELAVLTMKTTAPLTPTDYKRRVFESWKLGKRGEDNGLLMLVAIDEHEVRFETGYGLEGPLPDGLLSRIVREVMAPRLRAGDYAGGITAAMLACAARVAAEKNVALEWDGQALRYDRVRGDRELPLWAIILIALALIVLFSRLRGYGIGRRGPWWVGPGGGLGGFGGFGGFGGGSGGGSFGGFGGGSSGGGGGGGRW